MNFELAFAILIGFLGGFIFSVFIIINIIKKLMKFSIITKDTKEDSNEDDD